MNTAEVEEKAQRQLVGEFGSNSADRDGKHWVTASSARVYVRVEESGERTVVEVSSQSCA